MQDELVQAAPGFVAVQNWLSTLNKCFSSIYVVKNSTMCIKLVSLLTNVAHRFNRQRITTIVFNVSISPTWT